MRTILVTASRTAFLIGALGALLTSCRGMRASTVPLGGTHEQEEPPVKSARAALPVAAPETASVTPQSDSAAKPPSSPPVTSSAAPDAAAADPKSAAPGAFQVKPYVDHQAWTRLFDLEFDIKVGPGGSIDMKMVSHQEARFEVLSTSNGAIDKLAIDYSIYTSKLTIMGQTQDSPEELAGKRFVVTFAQGKPDVRDGSGAPSRRKSRSTRSKTTRASRLRNRKGPERAGATGGARVVRRFQQRRRGRARWRAKTKTPKVTHATGRLQEPSNSSAIGEKLALLDLGYTMTNAVDDKVTIEVELTGDMSVLDAPARYQTSTLQGPMEIRSTDPGGMQGRGTIKVRDELQVPTALPGLLAPAAIVSLSTGAEGRG